MSRTHRISLMMNVGEWLSKIAAGMSAPAIGLGAVDASPDAARGVTGAVGHGIGLALSFPYTDRPQLITAPGAQQ